MRSLVVVVLTAVLVFFSLSARPAAAQGHAVPAAWGWLALDAELAAQILSEGDRSGAGQLALDTHRALSVAVVSVTIARGQAYVDQLHGTLSQVLQDAGFRVPAAPSTGGDGVAQVGVGASAD